MGAITWFDELGLADVSRVGGKGANLGELTRAGLPVPPGFVVGADAYLDAMEHGGVRRELIDVEAAVDANDPPALEAASARMQELVRKAGVSEALRREIVAAYERLGETRVAVRSSATGEDTAGTSFAGMNRTFTNTMGANAVVDRVVECWGSLFGARVVSYRRTRGIVAEPAIAVVVQEMVDAERSGVMFTADPATGARDRIVIEAAFGLGEVVVSGHVEPDTYVVAKDGPRLLEVRVGVQTHKIVRAAEGDQRIDLSPAEGGSRVCRDDELVALATLGLRVESHYGAPQDIEWAIVGNNTFLVQSRPITTLAGEPAEAASETPGRVLVRGSVRRPAG